MITVTLSIFTNDQDRDVYQVMCNGSPVTAELTSMKEASKIWEKTFAQIQGSATLQVYDRGVLETWDTK